MMQVAGRVSRWLIRLTLLVSGFGYVVLAQAQQTDTHQVQLNEQERTYLERIGPVRMCVDPDWRPYEWVTSDGQFKGIAADLIGLISERSGVPLVLHPTPDWPASLAASRAGECQVLAFLNRTPEREEWLLFTDPYFVDPNVFITREDHDYIADLARLTDKTLVLPAGTSIEERMRRRYPNLNILIVESEADAFAAVVNREADLTLRSLTVAAYQIRKEGLFNLKIAGQLRQAGLDNQLRMGVLLQEPLLRELLNRGVRSITPQEVEQAINRHVQISVYTGIEYRWVFASLALSVAVVALFGYWVRYLKRLNRQLAEREQRLSEEINQRLQLTQELETSHHRLQQALKEEQEAVLAQQMFMRMVAHEFRTPLSVIRSSCDLLEANAGRDEALQRKALEHQRRSVSRLAELLDNALVEDQVEHSQWRKNAAWIELRSLAEEALSYVRPLCKPSHHLELSVEDVRLMGDRQLLAILLHNLLDNAIKYSPEGGRILLSISCQHDQVVIGVQDSGVGVCPEVQSTVFGKYQRGRVSHVPGLGLGLYLVDRIARIHGGQVSFTSEQGKGSSFRVSLPKVKGPCVA